MFYADYKSQSRVAAHCEAKFPGVAQDPLAVASFFDAQAASNILFSNGEYDPWRAGGVLTNLSDTLRAFQVPQGAHHLDLFFEHPDDPPTLRAVRDAEIAQLRAWLGI